MVDPERTPPRAVHESTFWIGAMSGLAVAAGLVLCWFAVSFAGVQAMLREFRGPVPAITRLVTHPTYQRLVPALVLALVVFGNLYLTRRKPLLIFLAVTAAAAIVLVVLGYWGATLPFTRLAAGIGS